MQHGATYERKGLLSASAEPESCCWAPAVLKNNMEDATDTQMLRLNMVLSHLTAERSSILWPLRSTG